MSHNEMISHVTCTSSTSSLCYPAVDVFLAILTKSVCLSSLSSPGCIFGMIYPWMSIHPTVHLNPSCKLICSHL
jgi:hypothetical protein